MPFTQTLVIALLLMIPSCSTDDKEGVYPSIAQAPEMLQDAEDLSQMDYLYSIVYGRHLILEEKDLTLDLLKGQGYYDFTSGCPTVYLTSQGNMLFFESLVTDTLVIVRENITTENQEVIEILEKFTQR